MIISPLLQFLLLLLLCQGGEFGGVQRLWEGTVLDCLADHRIAIEASFCPCYKFGKNKRRANLGYCFLQLIVGGGSAVDIFIRPLADSRGIAWEQKQKLHVKIPKGFLATVSVLALLAAYGTIALGQLFFFHVVLIKKIEEEAVKKMRRTMVHHARPLPKFDNPFVPQTYTREATKALSPDLLVRRRGERCHARHMR